MSIPPSGPSTPGAPQIPPLSPNTGGGTQGASSQQSQPYNNYMDPGGIWLRFFQQIMPGQSISAKEVQMFQLGVMKAMGQQIAHENERWKAAMKRMREAEEGND